MDSVQPDVAAHDGADCGYPEARAAPGTAEGAAVAQPGGGGPGGGDVDDPALVGVLRMQWHRVLVDVLGERLPDLGIVDVRFRLGPAPEASGRRPASGADGAADDGED